MKVKVIRDKNGIFGPFGGCVRFMLGKISLASSSQVKAKFHYAILVADIRSWSQTYSELEFGLSSSELAAS